jgi:PIN domain nuclease of toxin-antitoxin system
VRALLDTNSFLWFISGSDKLSGQARNFMSKLNNQLALSVSGLWEIAIKISLGRLELARPFEQFMQEQLRENAIDVLPIEIRHLTKLIDLPFHHRDPFDRLLIAQAIAEELPVISADTVFKNYGIEVIW